MTEDEYYTELEAEFEKKKEKAEQDAYNYGGGYEVSKGDYEGACLARGEYEGGAFS